MGFTFKDDYKLKVNHKIANIWFSFNDTQTILWILNPM